MGNICGNSMTSKFDQESNRGILDTYTPMKARE